MAKFVRIGNSSSKIDSKFGLHLRDLIKKRIKNPELEIGYIPGTARLPKTRRTTVWEYK